VFAFRGLTQLSCDVRAKGDHLHNLRILAKQEGLLLLRRRPKTETFNVKDFGPCPECMEWMTVSALGKHIPRCKSGAKHEKVSMNAQKMKSDLLTKRIPYEPSNGLVKHVYMFMKRDEVSEIAQNDILIKVFGEATLR
ncbi:unnamed protein product, partial [Owenia fusiformis]